MPLRLLDVLGPAGVLVDRVDAEADDLDIAFVEVGFELGHIAELGCAYRRKVFRVREQDRPLVPNPVMKTNPTFGCFGLEVRSDGANLQRHLSPPVDRTTLH